jgi:signal transduction histidine kinase
VARDRFGLRGMRERADTLGAALTIDSRPADGTRITLDVPATEAVA